MNNENLEQLAEIIPFPGVQAYGTKCCICGKGGQFEAYKIYEQSLAKAYFYCNSCKHYHPQGFNIDIKESPELAGVNAIPKGVITWEQEKQS